MDYVIKSITVATKFLPEAITGATVYLIRGRKGDANPDIAVALESSPSRAVGESDGLPVTLDGHVMWTDEPFSSPDELAGKGRGYVVLNLANGKLQIVDIDTVEVVAQ